MRTAKEILAEMALRDRYGDLRNRLETYAACLVRDKEAARDIVSGAIMAVLQNPESMDDAGLTPYLVRTVHNMCVNWRRDTTRHEAAVTRIRERESKAFQYYTSLLESCDPTDLFVTEITEIQSARIALLPEEVRRTYLLRCDGFSYKEIAAQMGISQNRVDKNLRKALSALRTSLSDYL